MEKISTAEEFLDAWFNRKGYVVIDQADDIDEALVEYAQIHVKAALKAASEKATVSMRHTRPFSEKRPVVDKESILSAYPESNIV